MMEISITPVDKKAQEEGSWGSYRGVKLLIARAGNTRFRASFKRLSRPFSKDIEKNTISETDGETILCQSLAEGVLRDWKGLMVNGKEIEYTTESAQSLLKNDPDCRAYVQEFSEDLDNYLKEDLEKTKGE